VERKRRRPRVVDVWENEPPVLPYDPLKGFGREEEGEVIQYSERYPFYERQLHDLNFKEEPLTLEAVEELFFDLPPTKDL